MRLQGLETLCCGSLVNQNKSLVRRPLGALKARRQRHRPSDLVWSGDDNIVRGTWRPPSFVEKLLSGNRGKVTVIVFTEETWWPSSNTLSECYNNVDVGVPLWLTEPRDKHPRQEFVISYPAL